MIPDFEMMKNRNRIWISYKNCNIIGIDAPRYWEGRNGELYNGWVLHRWVHELFTLDEQLLTDAKIDFERISRGIGIKIIGVDEI